MAGPSQRKTRVAYAIFEGGGAKGISHVGALRALEDLEVAVIGVAGASAGAIIAALVAAGYKADDIFDGAQPERHILSRYGKRTIDLLGAGDWQRFRAFQDAPLWLLLVAAAGASLLATQLGALPASMALAALAVLIAFPLVTLARLGWALATRRGLFSTEPISCMINQALADRLGRAAGEVVRFSDMPRERPLKIIVSDIRGRQLQIFDAQSTPNASVADAVAASAAIPFFFQPPEIRGMANDLGDVYADGGLVSNLPVWAFDNDKRRMERHRPDLGIIPIYAFELRPGSPQPSSVGGRSRARLGLLQHLVGALETGVFGSQAIVQRFVAELTVLPVATPLKTLDFDCGLDGAIKAYVAGRSSVKAELGLTLREQDATLALLEAYRADAQRRLRQSNRLPDDARLRAYIVGIHDRRHQISATADMALEADDRMVFDDDCPLAPKAGRQKDVACFEFAGVDARALSMTKQEHALLWPKLHSAIAIPVFDDPAEWAKPRAQDRSDTSRVVCLDSDQALKPSWTDLELRRWLQEKSVLLSETAIRRTIEEASRGQQTDL